MYHALALICGFTDRSRSRSLEDQQPRDAPAHEERCSSAINYGMGVPSLARGLNRHPADRQRPSSNGTSERYPRFWEWRDAQVQERDAGAPHRQRLWLAAAHHHQPEQAHAVQFPDAERRRRHAAAGGVAAVRGRHRAGDADP